MSDETVLRDWKRDEIVGLLLESGRIGLRYSGNQQVSLKSDRSLVTEADRAIERLLGRRFDRPEEGVYLIGEETVEHRDEAYIRDAFAGTAWVVDPIDGTAPYAHGMPHWGVSIALMRAGQLVEGAIYLPVTRELFMTDGEELLFGIVPPEGAGSGGFLKPLEVIRAERSEGGMIALTQDMARYGSCRLPNPVQALGCAVLPLVYLTLGRFMIVVGSLKLWDIAGVIPILLRGGFAIRFFDGSRLGDRVDEEFYDLSADSPKRWKLRNAFFAVPSDEVFEYISGNVDLGRK